MARVRLIKIRIRKGKIERRKKVSNVPGMKIQDGQLKKMSASERRKRKLGAKKGSRKRKIHMARILQKRKKSLQKRKRLGQ